MNWKFLQPLKDEFCKDLVKDSTDALRCLESISRSRSSVISGFSWDICSLYDSLTPELVLEALSFAISEHRADWTPDFIDWLLECISLSLKSCFGKYGSKLYRKS